MATRWPTAGHTGVRRLAGMADRARAAASSGAPASLSEPASVSNPASVSDPRPLSTFVPLSATVQVPRQRLGRWIDNFSVHHGAPQATLDGDELTLTSPDGAVAVIRTPYGPVVPTEVAVTDPVTAVLDHMAVDRMVAVVLARKGGHAVGVFHGERLMLSKVGGSYVQGRTKAGGWSQQRYARRRENQATQAAARASEDAVRVLVEQFAELVGQLREEAAETGTELATTDTTVVALRCGGDREMCERILADPRLADLAPLWQPPVIHQVGDPRLRVLQDFADQTNAVRIGLNDQARLR